MWDYFEISVNLFQVIVIIQTITNYLGSKFTGLKSKVCKIIFIIILFIELNYVNMKVLFEGIAIVIPIVIVFVYAIIALQGTWKKKLYCSVLIMALIVGVTSIVLSLVGIIGGSTYINLIRERNAVRMISLLIIQVLIFYITRMYLYNKDADVGEVSWDIWLMNIIIPIISIVVLAFILEISINLTEHFKTKGIQMTVFASMGILLINILIYLMYMRLKRENAKRFEYELLKQRYDIQEKNIKDIKQLYSNLQKVKHDVKHHMNLLKILLEEKETDKALNYLLEYTDLEYAIQQDTIFCTNVIINYIINAKTQEMKKKNIQFYCDVCGDINGVSDVDLNIILGNILDNAIEACEKVTGRKEIVLSIYRKASYLVIVVKNTYVGDLKALYNFKTTKKNQKEHGIGLQSVKEILENQGGKLNIENDEEQVIIKCIMEIDAE